MDLVELMAIFRACSPKTALIAITSTTSPRGVDVPCTFTYWTAAGSTPASLRVLRMTRIAPSPSSRGAEMWNASPDIPYPTISQ